MPEIQLIIRAERRGAIQQRVQPQFAIAGRVGWLRFADQNGSARGRDQAIHRLQVKRANALSKSPWAEAWSAVYTFQAKVRSPQVQAAAAPKGRTGVAVVVIGA